MSVTRSGVACVAQRTRPAPITSRHPRGLRPCSVPGDTVCSANPTLREPQPRHGGPAEYPGGMVGQAGCVAVP
jgi:hypothetical protein